MVTSTNVSSLHLGKTSSMTLKIEDYHRISSVRMEQACFSLFTKINNSLSLTKYIKIEGLLFKKLHRNLQHTCTERWRRGRARRKLKRINVLLPYNGTTVPLAGTAGLRIESLMSGMGYFFWSCSIGPQTV